MTETSTAVAQEKGKPVFVQPFAHEELGPLRAPIPGPIRLGRRDRPSLGVTREQFRNLVANADSRCLNVLYVSRRGSVGVFALRDESADLYEVLDPKQDVLFRFCESWDFGESAAQDEHYVDYLYQKIVRYWNDEDARREAMGIPAGTPFGTQTFILD